jgi:hypothetical protein
VSVSNSTFVHQPNYNVVAFSSAPRPEQNQRTATAEQIKRRSSQHGHTKPRTAVVHRSAAPPLYLLLSHMAPRRHPAYLVQTCILRVIDSCPSSANCSTNPSSLTAS